MTTTSPSWGMSRLRATCVHSFLALALGAAPNIAMGAEPHPTLQETFETHIPHNWSVASYRFTHPAFDTDWSKENLRVSSGLHLSLTPQSGHKNRFVGASLRHKERTHFGRYEVTMRPARGAGIVTGFFTYTGPYYDTRHDEIDIEFLGQDTTRLHVAWFVDGVRHNRFIPLGFDAATKPRTYAFEWHADRLRWFAEDRLLFEVTEHDAPLPKEPSYLFANLWAVDESLSVWAGHAPTGSSAQAFVGKITFAPFDRPIARGVTPNAPTRLALARPKRP
ncbi:hypothetical protein NBRC116594_10410 [Shimia sp. NS0008-38b]|uniref:family 16 glycosylhydrolase n=1 Tax=Shimia sp. NS0008-38b TaxID=3127653 RepID=UPI003103ACFD